MLLVCIYVDDVIYMSPLLQMMNKFRDDMQKPFEISGLGLMSYFLSLEIMQDISGIHISQRQYVEDLMKSFNMISCKPSTTPLSTSKKMSLFDKAEPTDITAYRKLIGKLIYVTQCRPYIAFLVVYYPNSCINLQGNRFSDIQLVQWTLEFTMKGETNVNCNVIQTMIGVVIW